MEVLPGIGEPVLRFSVFAGVFLAMAALEVLLPKRKLTMPRGRRWLTNLSIVGIDSLLVRLMANLPLILGVAVVPIAAVAAALWAERVGWGLLNLVMLPGWLEVVIALLVLDFAIWLQHLLSHKIPLLWQLHQVHHADRDIDVTTAIRFHPVEIALSMLWKIAWVLLLGPAALAVVLFEVILNGCAMFNHANVDLPPWLDRILRLFVVTPDMHRVHHSIERREHDSNYGFNLSIWDRVFRTYTAQPERGHLDMTIGLKPYQTDEPTKLAWSLLVPFRRKG
ncbi:MAG: sterol desaturase family protein [Hyphomicrobiaceae bacterium]